MADPTTPAQTTPGTALTPDQLSTILSGMKESADDGLTPYQRDVAAREQKARAEEAQMERRILARELPGYPGSTVGQHIPSELREGIKQRLRTNNPTRSPLQAVVKAADEGRTPFIEDIERIPDLGPGTGGSLSSGSRGRSVALGGGNAAEGVVRSIGPAADIYERPSVAGIPIQTPTGRPVAERVWSTAKGPETAAQREAAATAMGYGDHKVEQDEAWTGKWLIPGLPMDALDTPRRFLNMLGFGAAEALPDQTPDDDSYTSELMKAGRILMAPITWGMDAQEAFHDAVTKPVAGVVARAVKAAPGQEPGLLERAILNLGAGVESRRDDLGVLAAAMNPPALRVDDAERDLLVDRIGDRFLAAATSGEIREAAEMHPSLTRWENTKSVLDAISPDVSAFLMPGDDGRWQNISGMDVLNVSIDPDEARILAGDALARGNKAEGLLFTALSTETGRTLMGIGLDIVADPMWLVGPAKMGQVVAVGDQAWTVAKPALVAARELVGLAGGSSDDAMRVVVRALQGEEAALVTVRQGREATAQKVAGLRAEAARLAAGGEQQVVTQARAAVTQAEQAFAAMTQGAEVYQQAGGAARLAQVRGEIDAARALLGQVQRSPKSWVARRQGQIKTQLARALEAEANLGKIADQTAPWWYAGEKGLVQLHWGDATLELGAYARPWAVRAWDGLAGAAGRAVEPINPRAINRRVRSIMVERGLSQADAVQTLDLGSRLLWTAGTGADKLSRLGTDVVRVLGYALGTRFMRPATMLADQFSRIWSRDAAAMAQLTDRLRGTTNLIDLPNVSRQIWGDYQNALGAFFDALGSRESFLRASTQAIRREAHAAHALRVEAARAWQAAGRPASRRVTVRGREVVVDPAWLAPDYNRLQIHIDAIVAEAAEHLERGSGLLDPTSPFYRAELVPMLERFREMVTALRDMPEGVDLNQQVIRVVRSYKGTREHAAAAKGALDKAMKTVADIKEEGNVARKAEAAAEKAQKQVEAMDKLDELLTDDGAARALVRAHKDLERVEGAAPPPVRGPKGEAEAPTAKGEAKAGDAAEKPAGEAKDTATAKPEGEGAAAPDVDAPEADPLAGVKGDAEQAKAKAKGISDLLDEQRIRATRGKEEELRRAEEVQQLLAEKKAATPAKGKGKAAEAPVDAPAPTPEVKPQADAQASILARDAGEEARRANEAYNNAFRHKNRLYKRLIRTLEDNAPLKKKLAEREAAVGTNSRDEVSKIEASISRILKKNAPDAYAEMMAAEAEAKRLEAIADALGEKAQQLRKAAQEAGSAPAPRLDRTAEIGEAAERARVAEVAVEKAAQEEKAARIALQRAFRTSPDEKHKKLSEAINRHIADRAKEGRPVDGSDSAYRDLMEQAERMMRADPALSMEYAKFALAEDQLNEASFAKVIAEQDVDDLRALAKREEFEEFNAAAMERARAAAPAPEPKPAPTPEPTAPTTRPLADIDADLTAAKAARDEAMAARAAADIEATRLQAELQEAKLAQKKADEAVAAAKKAQAEEKKKAAAEKLRLDQERAAAEERARAAAEARAKEEAYASDPAYAPHTGERQQQNRPMADAGREAVRRAFTERVSMILPRGGMSEVERQEQIAATVDAALEALRASTGHKTVGEAAEALYQRAMGAGEKNKKLREMQGAARASVAMDNEIVATVKAGLERLRTDAVERRRLLLEFLSAPEEKKGELLEGLVDASIRKARLDALESGATVDELNAAYRGGDALLALEERIGKRKARAAVRHWRTYIDGADGRLGVSQANAAALRVEDAVGHLSGEAPVVRLDVLAHRIQRLLGTGREVKAADLVASLRTLIPSALDAEAAERAILAAERAAEQFAADANRVGSMVRGEGITQGTAAIKGVQEAVRIFKEEILASVKASTDEAARLMALAPERAKRLKDAEKAVKEAEEAYTRALPTVKAAPGEVIASGGAGAGQDVGHNLWTDGTRREATAWEDAIWNAWRVSSEGFTPEESMTALLGLLRNEPVIPRVAGEMGQRLGQMPAELTELSSRLKQVFDQYERWYQRVGFGFVTDPAERLKMWGTVAYVPHFRPTPEEVASGDIYRTFKPAGTVRGSGASAIDAQLSLQMNAKERRLIGGVAAEINAAAADHSVKFDLDGMLNRYLQSGKAISAAEYFVLLLRTNVVRRFDPVVDGAGVVARSADELAREASYVPLFQRSVQGRDMDLLLTGTAEDWARAGITADEVRAARTAMQEGGKEASPFGAWIRSIPLLQQTGNVEQIILAERVADLAAGRPLYSVSARIAELEAAGLEGRALWTELAEEMNTLATDHGLRHVEAGALEAVFADKGWRLYVPAQVAESMARLFEETAPTSMIGKLFKGTLDKFNQWYKSWYTIAQVSFTFRNAASNFMTNCLDIGPMGALSAQTNITATAMYTASNLFFNYGSIARAQAAAETGGTALQAQMRVLRPFLENGIDLGDGVVRTLDEAMALLVEHNVIARGYTPLGDMSAFNESMARSYYSWRQSPRAAAEALVKELPAQAADYGLTAFSVLAGAPLTVLPRKWGATLAQFVETQARCTNFIAGLKQGRTVEQAGQHVQKFLFNYEDLTGFQKTWMRSLIPFFTWTQKNLLLQAEMIREAPAFYQKQMQIIQGWGDFVEGIDRDAGLRPLPRQVYSDTETAQRAEQLRQRYILPLPKLFTGIEGIGLTGLGTPQEAAMDLVAQIGALADLPKVASGDYKGMRLLAQFNFIARMIVEGATGEDVFYGRPWTELNNAAMPLQTFAALETIRKQNIPGISSMAAAMHYGLQVALQPTITVEADYRERAYAPPGRIWLYRNTPWSQTIRKVAAATDAYAVSYMDDPKAAQTVWVAPPWLRTLNSFMGIGTMQDNPYHLVADEKREELREWHDTLEREGITRQSESSRLR